MDDREAFQDLIFLERDEKIGKISKIRCEDCGSNRADKLWSKSIFDCVDGVVNVLFNLKRSDSWCCGEEASFLQ